MNDFQAYTAADAKLTEALYRQQRRYTARAYHKAAHEVADLVTQKQVAYGDSFNKAGAILRVLYPDGIGPDKLNDALTVVRVVDKLMRIANRKDAFGENPWRDILGYALLSVVRDQRKAEARQKVDQVFEEAFRPTAPTHPACGHTLPAKYTNTVDTMAAAWTNQHGPEAKEPAPIPKPVLDGVEGMALDLWQRGKFGNGQVFMGEFRAGANGLRAFSVRCIGFDVMGKRPKFEIKPI